jgi:hypothetical protein
MEKIKLCVWDFDGTLIETPIESEENKQKWEKYYSKPWPYAGWWSHDESLDSNVWKMSVIKTVVDDFHREKKDKTTVNVLLTGRLKKLENIVKRIVNSHGCFFDYYLFNMGGKTLHNKLNHLDSLLSEYTHIRDVVLWDDRISHFNDFENWGYNLKEMDRIDSFCLNKVESSRWNTKY